LKSADLKIGHYIKRLNERIGLGKIDPKPAPLKPKGAASVQLASLVQISPACY
jgi:hypothetical protein